MSWTNRLVALGACPEAVEYSRGFPTAQTAWDACERGDWMLWWLGRVTGPPGDGRKALVDCCCEVALLATEPRDPIAAMARAWCIATVRLWIDGEPGMDLEDVRNAANDAADAAANDAADAAAYAACAAYVAAYAADAAAYAAACAASRKRVLAEAAGIVRLWFPSPPKEDAR